MENQPREQKPEIDFDAEPCNEFGVALVLEREIKKGIRENPDHFRPAIPPYSEEY